MPGTQAGMTAGSGVTLATGVGITVIVFAGVVFLLDRSAVEDALSIIPRKKRASPQP